MMSLTVMSFEDRFCISRKGMMEKVGGVLHQQKGYDGEGGWVHPQGEKYGHVWAQMWKALVGSGWTNFLLLYKGA